MGEESKQNLSHHGSFREVENDIAHSQLILPRAYSVLKDWCVCEDDEVVAAID